MRKLSIALALGLSASLILAGCQKKQAEQTQQTSQISRPSSPTNMAAWQKYMQQLVIKNMQGMTAQQPYVYFVPAGTDSSDQAKRDRQLEQVQGMVSRGVLPGNLIALGGPDSQFTANMLINAFTGAQSGSFHGVIVLFMGDKADEAKVAAIVKPTGAIFRFVQM